MKLPVLIRFFAAYFVLIHAAGFLATVAASDQIRLVNLGLVCQVAPVEAPPAAGGHSHGHAEGHGGHSHDAGSPVEPAGDSRHPYIHCNPDPVAASWMPLSFPQLLPGILQIPLARAVGSGFLAEPGSPDSLSPPPRVPPPRPASA